jgi:hypothetical protein
LGSTGYVYPLLVHNTLATLFARPAALWVAKTVPIIKDLYVTEGSNHPIHITAHGPWSELGASQ